MKLTVTRASHTHMGKLYRAGESFEGTQRLLDAFGDRLAVADDDQAVDEIDFLRSVAEAAGVKVDKRWRADRLREEIANANAANG